MAKIVAEYDTKAKTLNVTKDGKALDNVMHVSLSRNYNYQKDQEDDTYGCHVMTKDKSDEEGYSTHTHITANEDGDLETRTEKVAASKQTSDFIKGLLNRGHRR